MGQTIDLKIAQNQLELALKEIKSIKCKNIELLYDYVFEAHNNKPRKLQ